MLHLKTTDGCATDRIKQIPHIPLEVYQSAGHDSLKLNSDFKKLYILYIHMAIMLWLIGVYVLEHLIG